MKMKLYKLHVRPDDHRVMRSRAKELRCSVAALYRTAVIEWIVDNSNKPAPRAKETPR